MLIRKLLKKRGVKLVFGLVLAILFIGLSHIPKASAALDSSEAVINPELTAAAQGAERASQFLQWSFDLTKPSSSTTTTLNSAYTDNLRNTLQGLWKSTFQLVVIIYVAIVVILAFGYMVKANWLERWKRYIPWLAISLIASAFSFIVAIFVVNIFDTAIIRLAQTNVTELINIQGNFTNLQSSSDINKIETVNNTIFLMKSLTYTAYAIGGMMVIRMIILWMLIIFAPLIFPFVAFPATQSLGKMWVREFARWLLYGFLVALFLFASNKIFDNINTSGTTSGTYDDATSVNLSLPSGSSGAGVGTSNIVSDSSSYSKYITSIILLWISIILPWFLVRFAISFTAESSASWIERNKTSPRVQQLLKAITPPSRTEIAARKAKSEVVQPPLRTISSKEREEIIAPARGMAPPERAPVIGEQELPEGVVKAPPPPPSAEPEMRLDHEEAETIRAFQQMPPERALSAAGYSELSDVADKIERSTVNNEKITELARLEQEPDLDVRIASDLHSLRNPETIPSETKRQQALNFKNSILMSGASTQTKGIASLIRNDTTPLASQSIAREINERNINTVKEKTKELLESKKITSETTVKQLQDLQSAINNYQSVPSSRPGERHMIASSIEKAVRGITGGKEPERAQVGQAGEAARGTIPAASAKVLSEDELIKIPEGKELLESMEVLSASEVAQNTGGGIDALLAGDDITKAVADGKTASDFDKTKNQWIEYYKNTPIPTTENIKNRSDWINEQIKEQESLLGQISTGDFEKRKQALGRLEKILPFLMLGHYSLLDVTLYLKAKIAAAHTVLNNIKTDQNQNAYPPPPPPAEPPPERNFHPQS